MNADDSDPIEEQFVSILAECDDALAAGAAAPNGEAPPEVRQRLQRSLPCLHLLRRVLLRRPADEASAAHAAGFGAPYPTKLGRFLVRRELGRGGFGIVFLADDPHLGRPVALKVPRPEALASPDLRDRFLREAQAAARLDHPNLVPVYEAGTVGRVCYIVSAYCPGTNLALWLREQPGPVAPRTAATWVAAVAEAVQHAHSHGILHRDIKPSNILLVPRPPDEPAALDEMGFIPRLTDFGLAKVLEAGIEDTTSGAILGTPQYMAPEQAEGWLKAVGPQTDVYALGVILYELLTRQLPCRGPSLLLTLEQVRTQEPPPPRMHVLVPRDLEVICLKCLQKAPSDRYARAADLAEDLHRFLRGEPIRARPIGPLGRAWRWCRRPERMRDAGMTAFVNGGVATVACCLGLFLVLSGLMPVSGLAVAAAYLLSIICSYGVPQLWVARQAPARRVGALWAGLLLPLVLLAHNFGAGFDLIPSGGLISYSSDPSPWYVQLITVCLFLSIQMCAFVLALLAYSAHRQQREFMPWPASPTL